MPVLCCARPSTQEGERHVFAEECVVSRDWKGDLLMTAGALPDMRDHDVAGGLCLVTGEEVIAVSLPWLVAVAEAWANGDRLRCAARAVAALAVKRAPWGPVGWEPDLRTGVYQEVVESIQDLGAENVQTQLGVWTEMLLEELRPGRVRAGRQFG